MNRGKILLIITAFVLSACAWGEGDAPYNPIASSASGGKRNIIAQQPNTDSSTPDSAIHIMQANESYYTIATRYKVSLRDLLVINQLNPPYIPYIGQRLIIPSKRNYKVQRGDTLYRIAVNNDLALSELVRVNGLKKPYIIYPGQILRLPAMVSGFSPVSPTKATPRKPPPQPTQIQRKPAAKASPLTFSAAGNPIPPVSSLNATNKSIATNKRTRPVQLSAPPALDTDGFLWPVKGRIITWFGAVNQGLHNDGINIAAPEGTKVRAAQHGVVAYSGSELQGFGQLILIRHADNYVTAYAHNQNSLVELGQKVTRGQPIATVGQSGNVDRPQLHFQIRKARTKLNPTKLLGPA